MEIKVSAEGLQNPFSISLNLPCEILIASANYFWFKLCDFLTTLNLDPIFAMIFLPLVTQSPEHILNHVSGLFQSHL
jgi:hypothetical protein